ncbi:MAG: hypothetical protein VB071_09230 [Lawsonibacter sp.]|nr:hypothetical protein [Lawsonibacter sp.]
MQTIYYNTNQFIRHQDNVIDLEEYRRKQMLAQEGSLAPQPQPEELYLPIEKEKSVWEQPVLQEMRPRRRRKSCRAVVLDVCASLGIVVMTLTFTLRVLLL